MYDAIAALDEVDFTVFRLQKLAHGRLWTDGARVSHDERTVRERRIRRQLYLNPGFLRELLAYDPDLVVVGSYHAPAMQLAMYAQTLRRRPWVFWGELPHVRFSEAPVVSNERVRRALRRVALAPVRRFPTEVWAIGSRAEHVYRALVDDRIPVRNVPYFGDFSRFSEAGLARPGCDHLRFLFCGSLTLRKGADLVASAVETLVAEGWEFSLDVVGAGPLESAFRALPDDAGARVRLRGFLELEDVPDTYRTNDVLLFPSRHDGWGISVVEAMAAGMPVVSTTSTGSALDLISDGDNGLLLSEPTTEHLCDAMRRLLDHPDEAAAMGSRAQTTSAQCGHERGARLILDAIHSITRGARGAATAVSPARRSPPE